MQIYYDEDRVYSMPRLHPYKAGAPDQSGYVDFKANPEQIETSIEDMRPFADRSAIQAFYGLLREVNGPRSHLESCDCVFRPPGVHNDINSNLALSAHGRLYLFYRELSLNCSPAHTDWLCQRMMSVLGEIDSEMPAAEGVVGFTQNEALHTAISNGVWRTDGQFECDENDPGYGKHVMLSFWAYGDTNDEVFANLERVFTNIQAACRSISDEINASLLRGAREASQVNPRNS